MRKEKGFSFFRMAFRNVIRMPVRSLLYLAVFTVFVFTTFLGAFLLRATDNALLYLYDHYETFASLTPRVERDAAGFILYNDIAFTADEAKMIVSSPYVEKYSQRIYCDAYVTNRGTLDHTMSISSDDDWDVYWLKERILQVMPVRDLSLTRDYVNGYMRIVEGRAIEGGNEIIIPKDFCDDIGISVGDTVTVRLTGDTNTFDTRCYGEFKVVGIFDGLNDGEYARAEVSSEYFCKLVTEATGIPEDISPGRRIDVKLKTPDSIDGFIQYLNDNGFDFMNYQVLFNDASYNVAKVEIENVRSIVKIVLYTVLFVCGGLIIFLTVYFISNRSDEKTVLRALGLKRYSVNTIFCLELLFVFIVASGIGMGIGYGISDYMVEVIETRTVDTVVKIDESGDAEADSVLSYIGTIDSKAEVKFLISYTPEGEKSDAKKLYGENAYIENGVYKTYETMYDDEGKAYRVFGSGELTTGQILEGGFRNGVTIDCLVPETSGLKVGDVLSLHLFPSETVLILEYPEKYYGSRLQINFRVVGFGGDGDISVPIEDLAAIMRSATGSYLQ